MNTPTLLCTPIRRCLFMCLFLLISSAWYVVITLRVTPFNKRLANELSEGAQQVEVLNPLPSGQGFCHITELQDE